MNNGIKNLEPKVLWKNFANLGTIPRPSKKEEKVRQFIVAFGEKLNLETMVDPVSSVIIKKPASKGMENHCDAVTFRHGLSKE